MHLYDIAELVGDLSLVGSKKEVRGIGVLGLEGLEFFREKDILWL